MATVRTLDVAVRANTQNFEGGMKKVGLALRSAVAGLNFVTAAAASQEKSFLAMANAVAIGFATGGPVGLAIAGLGVGLGTIIGKIKEMDAEWEKALASMRAETQKLERQAAEAADKLFVLRGGDLRIRGLDRMAEQFEESRRLSRAASAAAEARLSDIGIGFEAPGQFLRALDALSEMRGRADMASETGKQYAAMRSEAESYLGTIIETTRRETELLGIQDEKARKVREIQMEAFDLMKAVTDLSARGVNVPGVDMDELLRQIAGLRDLKIAGVLNELPKKMEQVSAAAQIAARSVSDFLSAVVVRGAEAKDVLQSIAQSLLSMGIQRGVNAAFGIATP